MHFGTHRRIEEIQKEIATQHLNLALIKDFHRNNPNLTDREDAELKTASAHIYAASVVLRELVQTATKIANP